MAIEIPTAAETLLIPDAFQSRSAMTTKTQIGK
jgi:hypothetical protein